MVTVSDQQVRDLPEPPRQLWKIFFKVAVVLTLVVLALALAVNADTWRARQVVTRIGTVPSQLGFALSMTLLVISACLGGTMMFLYSGLLIALNRTHLPEPIRVRGLRLGVLFRSICFFGALAALTVWQQGQRFR